MGYGRRVRWDMGGGWGGMGRRVGWDGEEGEFIEKQKHR